MEKLTHEDLLKIIDEALHNGWTGLYWRNKGITELPGQIGQLVKLRRLDLDRNQLTALPESIGQFRDLERLDLDSNRLTGLPGSIGQLANLRVLNLQCNRLTSLPESIGKLSNLPTLDLHGNQLTSLPDSIGKLTSLLSLDLRENQLTSLPESIGKLTSLLSLDLHENQLTALPRSFAQLQELEHIDLTGNPLNPALESAYRGGLNSLWAYLRSLEEPEDREALYEAKLVFVGEGGVGKTSLLSAMTGREPKNDQPTTHGVEIDIQSLKLPHPDKEEIEIQFNGWDFGGQEVYKVTHQFFFSRRSVYLLLWEPRTGVGQCQVEDWLKLIRLRVGDDAPVIVVSTHCRTGERIARIDKPVFERDFGLMIVGFREVDSLVNDPATGEKVGVKELKDLIAEAAKDLEQMGMEFNRDWKAARDELIALSEPRIPYGRFAEVCAGHRLDEISTRTLAQLMHDLGYIVYYGDDPRLRDDVVLQPEWLTKAIGFVLEDRGTQQSDGILPDGRLKAVWLEHPFEGEPRYGPELYPFFLQLMEKYDVSYRLEDRTASLVAQHVPQVQPALPWLPEEDPRERMRRIGMVCVMDDEPPGLVPWMIVRTHEYAHQDRDPAGQVRRLHWQKGVFLRNRGHGEAVLELRGREFHVYTEAVWPQFFMDVLRRTLRKLITDNWPGMKGRYFFAVPCRERRNDKACDGRFDIGALRQFLEEGDRTIRCQVCRQRQDIVTLLFGFEEEDSRQQLARFESKMDSGFEQVLQEIEGLESRVANHVMAIMHAIADESKEGPRLFTVEVPRKKWYKPTVNRFRLKLWCEAEGCQHPVLEKGKGVYEFEESKEWLVKIAPYANLIAGVLRTAAPVAAPAVDAIFGQGTVERLGIKAQLDAMKEVTGQLLKGELDLAEPRGLREGLLSEPERAGVLALHSFLRREDPNHQRLGLTRVPTYTGDFLWLCEEHFQRSQSKIPDSFE